MRHRPHQRAPESYLELCARWRHTAAESVVTRTHRLYEAYVALAPGVTVLLIFAALSQPDPPPLRRLRVVSDAHSQAVLKTLPEGGRYFVALFLLFCQIKVNVAVSRAAQGAFCPSWFYRLWGAYIRTMPIIIKCKNRGRSWRWPGSKKYHNIPVHNCDEPLSI